MNATQAAILRALELAKILDVEHDAPTLHGAFRAVRHELRTLRDLHCPQAAETAPVSTSAHTGLATQPGSLRHKILAVLEFGPMADFQTREYLSRDRHDGPHWPLIGQVRRRRHELVAAGWLEVVRLDGKTRKVRQPGTNRDCTVYQLTDPGWRALRRLRSGQVAMFSDNELSNGSATTPDKTEGCDVRGHL